MTNGEKYKDEIIKVNYDFALSDGGTIIKCRDCDKCKFYGDKCKYYGEDCAQPDKIKWLLEEYKEPILTNDEKTYLKSIITHFKKDDYLISKQNFGSSIHLHVAKVCGDYRYDIVLDLDLTYFKLKFDNMSDDCWYKLDELVEL